jgi:peptide-methionine (S)-S-oxide reductase
MEHQYFAMKALVRKEEPMTRSLPVLAILIAAATGAVVAQPRTAFGQTTAMVTFAGGCFWCVEADFDKVPGVISTTPGYTGGKVLNPTYSQVSAGNTGHTEAVEIVYDPSKISYQKLLDVFWRNHDPLAKDRQFCDRGDHYRPAIFHHNEEQRKLAEASKQAVQAKFAPRQVHTEIVKASVFYKAEDYHQDYYEKNPVRYKFYRFNCGRDQRLEELWGKADKSS